MTTDMMLVWIGVGVLLEMRRWWVESTGNDARRGHCLCLLCVGVDLTVRRFVGGALVGWTKGLRASTAVERT